MNLNTIRQSLRAARLERLADEAERLTQPAIVIKAQAADDDDLPIGASKFGGRPDLSPDMRWPEHDGRPLGFLAQFNLAEVAPYDVDGLLPRTGLLSFFYDFTAALWGTSPEDRGGWQVIYLEQDPAALVWGEWPTALAPLYQLPTQRAIFAREVSLTREPGWTSSITLDSDEHTRFIDAYFSLQPSEHQLLGYPLLIHSGAMPLVCELATSNELSHLFPLACSYDAQNEPHEAEDETTTLLLAQAHERWRLLFQLGDISGLPAPKNGSEWYLREVCEIWNRGGLMYFWIENGRLAQRDFSHVWLLGASRS
jgi:uncharacterized protein YwqG